MNIVLLSNHWYFSPRQAGFHHLAHAFHSQGHHVVFVTVGLSWISYLRRDYRTRYKGLWNSRNKLQQVKENFLSYVHFTPLHPHTLLISMLDTFFSKYMNKYDSYPFGDLEKYIQKSDVIIYESSVALFLFRRCSELAQDARHIYRVSDDIAILRSTPECMIKLEKEIAPAFDLISVPCSYLQKKFLGLSNVGLHLHGLNTEVFKNIDKNPYTQGTKNVVFVGSSHFDAESIYLMALQNRQIFFHIIGNVHAPFFLSKLFNVCTYGELPFIKTVPYIYFADVGLQTIKFSPQIFSMTDSLKVIQYRYCGLPIVSPEFLDLQHEGVFFYKPGDRASCSKALQKALLSGKNFGRSVGVHTWSEVSIDILNSAGIY